MQWASERPHRNGSRPRGVGRRERRLLQRPVPGRVISNYGLRLHPILGYSRMHRGLDFRAGYGTPILAATDGRVDRRRLGRRLWQPGPPQPCRRPRHLLFAHEPDRGPARAASVRQGQVIGYVGSTGLSTGPHLHYETVPQRRADQSALGHASSAAPSSRRRARQLPELGCGACWQRRSARQDAAGAAAGGTRPEHGANGTLAVVLSAS